MKKNCFRFIKWNKSEIPNNNESLVKQTKRERW